MFYASNCADVTYKDSIKHKPNFTKAVNVLNEDISESFISELSIYLKQFNYKRLLHFISITNIFWSTMVTAHPQKLPITFGLSVLISLNRKRRNQVYHRLEVHGGRVFGFV